MKTTAILFLLLFVCGCSDPGAQGGPGDVCYATVDCGPGLTCYGSRGCDQTWTCTPTAGLVCTADLIVQCTCDGLEIRASSTCPGVRIGHVGLCTGDVDASPTTLDAAPGEVDATPSEIDAAPTTADASPATVDGGVPGYCGPDPYENMGCCAQPISCDDTPYDGCCLDNTAYHCLGGVLYTDNCNDYPGYHCGNAGGGDGAYCVVG